MSTRWHPALGLEELWELRNAIRLLIADPDEEHTQPDGASCSALEVDEIKILGRNLIEVMDTPELDTVTSGSDWLLLTAAQGLGAQNLDARWDSLLAAVAASPSRSPLIGYDGLYESMALMAERSENWREVIELQRRSLSEALRARSGYDARYNLIVLGCHNADAGYAPSAVQLFTGVLRTYVDDRHMWSLIGTSLLRLRAPSVARIAFERAIALAPDDVELTRRVTNDLAAAANLPGAADCPAAMLDALRAAAATQLEDAEPVSDVAYRIVDGLRTTPVKEYPPVPDREEVAKIRARLVPIAGDLDAQLSDEWRTAQEDRSAVRAELRTTA